MKASARALGHAIHPILIVFPLGLLTTAVIFDLIYLFTSRDPFALASGYIIAVGVLGGLAAAVPGLIDWLSIPASTRAKQIGLLHGAGNVVVVALFAISWLIRSNTEAWRPNAGALIFSFAGLILAAVTGWMGGELVERLGIGVHENADVNAPSSLGGGTDRRSVTTP